MAAKEPFSLLKEQIETRQFSRVYLLMTDKDKPERYLMQQARDQLLSAVTMPDDNLNFTKYSSDTCRVDSIISDISTMPMFAEYRVVLVEDSGYFKKGNAEMEELLPEVGESAILIFCEQEVDRTRKLYKWVDKNATVLSFKKPDSTTLVKWLTRRLAADGYKVENGVPEMLIQSAGNDMNGLSAEADKLRSYCLPGKEIRRADVEAVSIREAENRVFEMVSAVAAGKKDKAIRLYTDLLELREPPMRILFLLAREFNILMQVKKIQEEKKPGANIARLVKVPPFAVKNYTTEAAKFRYDELLRAVDLCQEMDLAIKEGRLSDRNAVERVVVTMTLRK